jgi:hypothetical protein
MQGNKHLHSRYRPHTTASMARSTAGTYVHVYVLERFWLARALYFFTCKFGAARTGMA